MKDLDEKRLGAAFLAFDEQGLGLRAAIRAYIGNDVLVDREDAKTFWCQGCESTLLDGHDEYCNSKPGNFTPPR